MAAALFDMFPEKAKRNGPRIPCGVSSALVDRVLDSHEGGWIDGAAIHIRVRGENAHHMVEVCFKAVARALRQAIVRRGEELPSTKGQL